MRTPLSTIARHVRAFRRDSRGSITSMFAIAGAGVFLSVGTAMDFGQSLKVRTTMTGATDAASLIAAKLVSDGVTDFARIETAARKAYDANFQLETDRGFRTSTFVVAADFTTNTVTVTAGGSVPTVFMGLAGITDLDVGVTSTSTLDRDQVEVAMMLDLTGSMGDRTSDGTGRKIEVLEKAAKSLVTTLIPTDKTSKDVRIALAPYAAGVNAGALAPLVNGGFTTSACVIERKSGPMATDASPVSVPFAVGKDCPARAVLGLTGKRSALLAQLEKLPATGTTAGHLGTAWAFGLLSPAWKPVLGSATGIAYGTGRTRKIAILMTDGLYNTWGGAMSGANEAKSQAAAVDTCEAMKAKGITVYTIGFEIGADPKAVATLKSCASTDHGKLLFYNAKDGAALLAAYAEIAGRIQQLRLAS